MTVPRLIAIALIFAVAAAAWMMLGTSVELRTVAQDRELREKVGGLWGKPQVQQPPSISGTVRSIERIEKDGRATLRRRARPARGLSVSSSDIRASFDLDQRKKGLLWYATYNVAFQGRYEVRNAERHPVDVEVVLAFPNPGGVYDGFVVRASGKEVPARIAGDAARASFRIPSRGSVPVEFAYRTQGLDSWAYAPSAGIGAVKDLTLAMTTDFRDVDFPDGAVSPTRKRPTPDGWELVWRYSSLVSGRQIALAMPKPANPGPLAARISLFAPVSLLFFFAALVLNSATSKVRIHPVNFAFLAAGFFAFDLLLVYLVDHIDINAAFLVASLTSVALCVGYLTLVLGRQPILVETALSQFIFLVLFSYSFLFEGYTGLAITIGAILTLAYYMAKTGRVDWGEVFSRGGARAGILSPADAGGYKDS